MHRRLVHVLAAFAPSIACGEDLRLPIVADTSICAFESPDASASEVGLNAGGAPRIKMKGIENLLLLDIDAAKLKGRVVTAAVLHLRGTDDRLMVRRVGVSTVAVPWSEGGGSYAAAKPGEATFLAPAADAAWGAPGASCFLDAVGGRSGTIWAQGEARPVADDWFEIPVDGRLLEACAAGLSHGLCVSDDDGQTMNVHPDADPRGNRSNNVFFSREQNASAPYLAVTVETAPSLAVGEFVVEAEPWAAGADATSGGIVLSWPGPVDDAARSAILGYRIECADGGEDASPVVPRWQVPTPPPPGEHARAFLGGVPASTRLTARVWVVGRGGAVVARGAGEAMSSAKRTPVTPLAPVAAPVRDAGDPPADANGAVWAVPDLVKVNPLTGNAFDEAGVDYRGEPAGAYRRANPAWSGATGTVSLSALRGEWVAFQLVCEDVASAAMWSVTPGDLAGPRGATIPAGAVRLSRAWYLHQGDGGRAWYADPLRPLAAGETFAVPDVANAVPGQRNQTIYGELFVPKDAAPGAYRGSLAVSTGTGKPIALALELTVAAPVIPDAAAFVLSMNAYSSPGAAYGPSDSDVFVAGERSFYRVAHEHRTELAVLGYHQNGAVDPAFVWPLAGDGDDMHCADWSAFDLRWGPLFDGSAFAGTPRAGVPLDHWYLAFHENWPTPIAGNYRWNDLTWEEHWKKAGRIDEGFSDRFRAQWVATMKDFIRHAREKNWSTSFQVYLNDKYVFKQYDPTTKRGGTGASFWLLDEPQHLDDFLALAFFGRLTREAQAGRRGPIVFRCDISRPQWGRDTLDRVIDCNVSGGFGAYRPWLEEWRQRHGQRIWTYGGTPSVDASALGIEHRIVDLYARGVEGYVPWLVLGDRGNWTSPADTCVLYDGQPVGVAGACASLRLKAYRRGEQDAEYLRLFERTLGGGADDPNRTRLAAALGSALKAERHLGRLDAQGAGVESFAGDRPEAFASLRAAIVERLK